MVTGLQRVALIARYPLSPSAVVRDPDDDYLPALALNADAEAVVTGDGDLLDHSGLEPDAITPREACRRVALPLGD
jgi:predicted nucleic acid-binding protein